jgi:hypothetical protein
MKPIFPLVALLGALFPLSAQAAPTLTPRTQTRVFALALTLRACDLRAQDYIEAVKSLQKIDDTDTVKAQVKNSSREAFRLRRTQSEAYAQAAQMLTRLGAPPDLHDWAAKTAERFKTPLVYDDDARKMAKNEPEAGQVMAELSELETVNALASAQQPSLALWLSLTGGPLAIWTADVGSYAADLRRAGTLSGQSHLVGRAALRLLLKAPTASPSSVRGDLAEIAPTGGGNLQDMATVLPEAVPREKVIRVYTKLVDDYEARAQIVGLDKFQ